MELGLIGCGNMGGALVTAAARRLHGQEILLANRTPAKAAALASSIGGAVGDNLQVAAECRYIMLGVKPHQLAGVLAQIAPVLAARTQPFVLVSMAAGVHCADLQAMAGAACPVLRIMPNLPVAVGRGMIPYCGKDVQPKDVEDFLQLMTEAGRFDALDEGLMDVASAVAGCGPAFACLFLEGLADGGVRCGLPRAKALQYAAAALEGAAAQILATGEHPASLKDRVCSPGGSTIAGVHSLETGGVRAAAIDAVTAACRRNEALGAAQKQKS